MYQLGNILAKEIGDCIKMCMCLMCGMSENKYKQPKFEEICQGDSLYYKLIAMIDEGMFNEAENSMYEHLNPKIKDECYTMLCVYEYMNEFDDEFIEANDYTRDEIKDGVILISKGLGAEVGFYFTDA